MIYATLACIALYLFIIIKTAIVWTPLLGWLGAAAVAFTTVTFVLVTLVPLVIALVIVLMSFVVGYLTPAATKRKTTL